MTSSSGHEPYGVLILAGGLGKRIRKVVSDRPKSLAEISGRPFLSFLFKQISQTGLGSVTLCTGFRGREIEKVFGSTHCGLKLSYSLEPEPLGTGGALRYALPAVSGQTLLVLNGDSYCGLDLETLLQFHEKHQAPATIALVEVSDTSRFGSVEVSSEGRISTFKEKSGEQRAGLINAGVYVFSRTLVEEIPSGRTISLEHDLFPKWVNKGIAGYLNAERFIDIGTPDSYAKAEEFFSD